MRNPPASPQLAVFTYSGPPLGACGNPTISLSNASDGASLGFLTATFNSGTITISLLDSTKAVKGNYALQAVFTLPGSFSFPLGISLQVKDICDDSEFPAAPVLSPNSQNYYTK